MNVSASSGPSACFQGLARVYRHECVQCTRMQLCATGTCPLRGCGCRFWPIWERGCVSPHAYRQHTSALAPQSHASPFPAAVVQSNVVYERQSVAERTSRHFQQCRSRPDQHLQLCVSLLSDRCDINILSPKLSKLTGAKILSSD